MKNKVGVLTNGFAAGFNVAAAAFLLVGFNSPVSALAVALAGVVNASFAVAFLLTRGDA